MRPSPQLGKLRAFGASWGAELGESLDRVLVEPDHFHRDSPLFPARSGAGVVRRRSMGGRRSFVPKSGKRSTLGRCRNPGYGTAPFEVAPDVQIERGRRHADGLDPALAVHMAGGCQLCGLARWGDALHITLADRLAAVGGRGPGEAG